MNAMLDAALAYAAAKGWPVFPCRARGPTRKSPLTEAGYKDATADPAMIARWWRQYPDALIGTPTGISFVVLDIDARDDRDGFATLANLLGGAPPPQTRTARTASGGQHLYFEVPDPPIRNTAGARGRGIGPGLDWRGRGGYVILPAPGTGYEWKWELPLAPVPLALMPKPEPVTLVGEPGICTELTAYGEAALRGAAAMILGAPNGQQEATLNGEAYSIGRAAGAGLVPVELALEVLILAGQGMPSYDPSRPWQSRGQAPRCPAQSDARCRGAVRRRG